MNTFPKLKNEWAVMNLPRVGKVLGYKSKFDHEQVGESPGRTARDAALTAVNNGVAVAEDLSKAVTVPLMGLGAAGLVAFTGRTPDMNRGEPPSAWSQRLKMVGALAGLSVVGAVTYTGLAAVDAVQAGAALLLDAPIKIAQGKL
jgi:hypothetical protein